MLTKCNMDNHILWDINQVWCLCVYGLLVTLFLLTPAYAALFNLSLDPVS